MRHFPVPAECSRGPKRNGFKAPGQEAMVEATCSALTKERERSERIIDIDKKKTYGKKKQSTKGDHFPMTPCAPPFFLDCSSRSCWIAAVSARWAARCNGGQGSDKP